MIPTVTPADGLFGPTSITWRVHTQIPALPAALRAFQLQALHPRTIRGMARHCRLDDPAAERDRLRRQLGFVALRTFGTREQAERAGERVRALHARLVGLDPGTGALFRLDEEENLRWAHCAETASHLELALRSGVPLTPGERDAYVAEQRRSARLVGLEDAPGTVADLERRIEQTRPLLAVTDEAREALRASTRPRLSLRPFGLGSLPAAGALAFATLPAWARSLYGFPGDEAAEIAANAALTALRAATLALPERLVAPEISAARLLMRTAAETGGAGVAA